MVEKTVQRDRFNWWLPIYGAVGGFVLFLPFVISGVWDIVEVLYFLVVVPIISLILLVVSIRRKSISVLSMLAAYCAVSLILMKSSYDLRTAGRWILWSKVYKSQLLAQPNPAKGELRHMEWDGWGFPGAGDTYVYLVFDPSDSLAAAAKSHSPAKLSGIPCEVPKVRRLESHWYSVVLYTDTNWGECIPGS